MIRFASPAHEKEFERAVLKEGRKRIARMEAECKATRKRNDRRLAQLVREGVAQIKRFM